MMYEPPYTVMNIAGQDYTFTADMGAYCRVHELALIRHRDWIPVVDEETGQIKGRRMRMTPDTIPLWLECFAPGPDWQSIVRMDHPSKFTDAWLACELMMSEAGWDETEEDAAASSFRTEPEEPLGGN